MAQLENAVRGIIQFPYESRSRRKTYEGVLLELQKHPRTGRYSYILPGGRLENGQSYEEALWREIWEELGLQIQGLGAYYEYQGRGGATTRVYVITHVHAPFGNIRANNISQGGKQEVHGLGGYNVGSHAQIPDRLAVGHVLSLISDLYHPTQNPNPRTYHPNPQAMETHIRQLTHGLPRLDGYFNSHERHQGPLAPIMTWDEQRAQWKSWLKNLH